MTTEQKFLAQFPGMFAIKQGKITVVPVRQLYGKKVRIPFDTEAQAEAWARKNYRNEDGWRVFQIRTPPASNGDRV